MDEKEILLIREDYYNKIFVLMEMVKCLQKREFSIMEKNSKKKFRYLYAKRVDALKLILKKLDIYNNNVNLYHSIAYLDYLPEMNFNLSKRKSSPSYQEFDKNHAQHILGADIFFDFDGKTNFKKCYEEAKEFKKVLDESKLPYYLINSSNKGFHFTIESEYFPNLEVKERFILYTNIIFFTKQIYNFSCLDKGAMDQKRIKKLPYSFVKDGSIALPLTDEQFNNFSQELVSCKNVLKNVTIKNRGLLTRKHGLSDEELKRNVELFIRDYQQT